MTPATGSSGTLNVTGPTAEGVNVTKKPYDDGWKLTISGLRPQDFGETFEVAVETAGGTSTVKVSVLSYIYEILSSKASSDAAKDAMLAMYNYYTAALAYLSAQQTK